MSSYVLAPEVYSAHLMVKDHIELQTRFSAESMASLAKQVHTDIARLRLPALHPSAFTATRHPDFVKRMTFVETKFAEVNDLLYKVEQLWKEKSVLLDQCLQLRVFERDIHEVGNVLLYN